MDLRAAVAVHLCLIAAQASCQTVVLPEDAGALNQTAHLVRTTNLQPLLTVLQHALKHSNQWCQHLNGTELGEPEERPLTSTHLSYFSCYTLELSKLSHMSNLNKTLNAIGHQLEAMAVRMPDSSHVTCSLPKLKGLDLQGFDLFHYVWCLLQRLDHRLRNATF